MSDWQRKLNLKPEWQQASDNEITVHQLAAVVAARLKALTPFPDDEHGDLNFERDELIWQFEDFAKANEGDADDFDHILSDLYDWGDSRLDDKVFGGKKACWVAK